MSTFVVNHSPYLQLGDAPLAPFAGSATDRVQIIWQTMPGTASGNDSFAVEYRRAGAPTWIAAGPSSTIDTGVSNRVNRFVDVTGLDFDADYEYRVRHMRDGSVVNDYQATFHTRLPTGSSQPFTFVAYGDSASGNPPTGFIGVQNRINTITSSFSVLMGDNAYGGGTHANYDLRFDPTINAPTTQYNASHVEYYALGNHDIQTAAGQPARDNYAVPIPVAGVTSSVTGPADGPAENNYSFDYGNAHFTIFDSNNGIDHLIAGISTAEADWLLADVQASTAKWKFVVYHHMMSLIDGFTLAFADQLRAAGVDVLLCGHIHSYNRSKPGTYSFSEGNDLIQVIGGTGGESAIVDNQGFVKIDATATNLTVSYIRADTGATADSFSVISQSTGSVPTDVALSANTVPENSANNTVVGTLTTTDPDAGDTHTYTLTNDAGGRFGISGNQLVVANGPPAGGLDFETISSHSVTVRSTDSTGLSFSKNFTINVTNVNEAPTANSNAYSVNQGATLNANDATGTVGGTNDDSVLVNDTDPENNTLSAVLVAGPTHASGFSLNPDGTFTYTHNNDSATSDSFTYEASDGTNQSNIATVTITINPSGGTTTVSLQEGVNGYAGTIDTTIKVAFPTSTSGSSATTLEAFDNPDKGSLLRWELPSSLTGSIVQSASITLWVTNGTTTTYQLYELLQNWTEGGATWNQYAAGAAWGTAGANQVGVDRAAAVLASFASPATGFVTINLNSDGIALVQKWINTPSTNHGITIQNYVTTTNDGFAFASSEAATAADRPKLTITYGSGSPLMAASTASVTSSASTGSKLTKAALARIGQEATARWLTIAPADMHDAIRTAASSITFAIADLPGQTLGKSFEQTILIDRDAAGFGWFIDRTPRDDREFGASHDALPTSPAYGHMDLLSVVAHEFGHTLGYDHDSTFEVMHESLEAGHRAIAIDRDAAGFGRLIDRTPRDAREFGVSRDSLLTAPADGHRDLMSVVPQEIGQILGVDHDSALPVMGDSLEAEPRTIAIDAFFEGVGSHHGGPMLNPFL